MSEALSPNTTIGQYTIVSKIGAGGMGDVYRARDAKLSRDVAIKVLPASFANDEDRLRRFEQEARATSALNHPNILTLHDIGEYNGKPYLVTELLEGEELRDRLNEGSIPLRKVIDYAQQIVSGLSAAHEKGIVHRDLKPENIFITKDDRVKILDFGLAKLREKQTNIDGSEDATRRALTNPGAVMGTAGYMSPEQVRGHVTDHRSDIFSFGVILYEMLTGERAFHGASMVEMMHSILKDDIPDIDSPNARIPPALDKLMRRCLEKKPEHRFHSAHDLGFALEALSTPTSASGGGLTTAATAALVEAKRSEWHSLIPWMIAAALLLGLVTTAPFALKYLRRPVLPEAVTSRFTISSPNKSSGFSQMSISPDGRNLVFLTTADGKTQLWIRPMDSFDARPLPGTEGVGGFHFWSPDSRSVAFATPDKVKRIDLADGTVQTICEKSADIRGFSGTWNRDGVILFFAGNSGILRVPATGGKAVPLPGFEQTNPDLLNRWPQFLPDGKHFLYLESGMQRETSDVFVGSIDGGEPKKLLSAQSNAVYSSSTNDDGYLLFARDGALLGQAFDPSKLTLLGEQFRVSDQVRINQNERVYVSVSDNGTLVYDPNAIGENRTLTWFDRTGKQLETIGTIGLYQRLRFSPDGKYLAVSKRDPNGFYNIDVIDLTRGAASRLTSGSADVADLAWSPDGNRIVWTARQAGMIELRQKLASGAGQEEVLYQSQYPAGPTDWSSDGKYLLFTQAGPKTKQDIWILPLEGDRKPILFFQTPTNDSHASFSPDGRFIAYRSEESGRSEVYVQTFPPSAGKWLISTSGGLNIRWRHDGRELFYFTPDGKVMSVEIKPGNTFEPGIPKPLFDLLNARTTPTSDYDISNDGQRFLLICRQADVPSTLAVVVNWTANLQK